MGYTRDAMSPRPQLRRSEFTDNMVRQRGWRNVAAGLALVLFAAGFAYYRRIGLGSIVMGTVGLGWLGRGVNQLWLKKEAARHEANVELHGVEEPDLTWDCPRCEFTNPNTTYRCEKCRKSLV